MTAWTLIKQGGIAMYPLIACSIFIVAVILERLWFLSHAKLDSELLLKQLAALLAEGRKQEALALAARADQPVARIARAALYKMDRNQEEVTDALTVAADAEIKRLSYNLPILGTIGNIAPFIGLFGTVLGIMRAFQDIATHGSAGTAVVAAGIAEALIATAAGLGIAILAVISYNFFLNWVEKFRLDLEFFATEMIHEIDSHRPVLGNEPKGA